ncbi:hypothetical protein GCM10007036_14120 [Alsobacter metallidurans]|uniref:Uncharacterized protein n=1 Tax=Alsobacter metallidurans TaxID=340221 RepID=A0A917I612_9HYPH|nr:hypothetical protein [Alsobacter metallidurans]GGH14647.1 hypothetical protein GCM10007036_14120 [Alsobacter metallidurans]
MSEFICPQQGSRPSARGREAKSYLRADGTCSYCGSITEQAFFAAVEAGLEVTPTDKSYKVYVDVPEERAGQPRVVSVTGGDDQPGPDWIPADPAHLEASGWMGGGYNWMQLAPRGATRQAKFYLEHLSYEGQIRFVALVNAKGMQLAYPGFFYVAPFFCEPVRKGSVA